MMMMTDLLILQVKGNQAVRAGSDRVRVKITQNRNNFKRKFTIFFFKVHSLLANNSEREI